MEKLTGITKILSTFSVNLILLLLHLFNWKKHSSLDISSISSYMGNYGPFPLLYINLLLISADFLPYFWLSLNLFVVFGRTGQLPSPDLSGSLCCSLSWSCE